MPDREKVISNLQGVYEYLHHFENTAKMGEWVADALALIKEQEAVVRCKDCKWWDKKDDSNYGYCHACKHGYHSDHWEIGIYRTYKGDWFCADGERK